MAGMTNVNAIFIMIYCVQVKPDHIIKTDKRLMNIISKTIIMFSVKMNVKTEQIKKSLMIAPLYPLFFYYLFTIIALLIQTKFAWETLGMFFMLLPFVAGAIIFYFAFVYAFIYIAQLFLLRYFYINFWSILFFTLLHTMILISLGFIILNLVLNDSWTLFLFSIPTAISYWILLFKESRK